MFIILIIEEKFNFKGNRRFPFEPSLNCKIKRRDCNIIYYYYFVYFPFLSTVEDIKRHVQQVYEIFNSAVSVTICRFAVQSTPAVCRFIPVKI